MLRFRERATKCVLALVITGVIRSGAQTGPTAAPTPDDLKKAVQAAQDAMQAAQKAMQAAQEAAEKAEKQAGQAGTSEVNAAKSDNAAKESKIGAAASAQAASSGAQTATAAASNGMAAAGNAKKNADIALAASGVALNGSTNVSDNIDAQVVLLPRKQAERVFSKEIGRHYAVIQVVIDNKSKDAAFVLHSIFVDYSKWALSGISSSLPPACKSNDNLAQGIACPGQVASIESRVIRGELQDASVWTWRNGVIRAVVLVGGVASGIPAFSSKNALKYVGAYNGQFVPGMEVFWPDATVAQLNRVSDFGFQTNKIFGKEDSDLVYAFFPIDRFLTPGMKNIFLNAPAVLFAPAQIFIDQRVGKHCVKAGSCLSQSEIDDAKNLLENMAADGCIDSFCVPPRDPVDGRGSARNQRKRDEKMLELLTVPCTPESVAAGHADSQKSDSDTQSIERAYACRVQDIVNRVSLNSIVVRVQGIMTVDLNTVPGTITDVTFDQGNSSLNTWNVSDQTPVEQTATITGRFLTGAIPSVTSIIGTDGKNLTVDDYVDSKSISVVTNQSNDTKLVFKLKFAKTIPSGSKLHFTVTKYDPKDTNKASPLKGNDFELSVNYSSEAPSAGANGGASGAANKGSAIPISGAVAAGAQKKK